MRGHAYCLGLLNGLYGVITSELWWMGHAIVTGAVENDPVLRLTGLVLQHHYGKLNAAPLDALLCTSSHLHAASSCVVNTTNNIMEARIHNHISNLRFSI